MYTVWHEAASEREKRLGDSIILRLIAKGSRKNKLKMSRAEIILIRVGSTLRCAERKDFFFRVRSEAVTFEAMFDW